jgi:hypothetical protein
MKERGSLVGMLGNIGCSELFFAVFMAEAKLDLGPLTSTKVVEQEILA